VPVPTSRPRLPEADDLAVTDEPRAGAWMASNGEYEDEDYPPRPRGYVHPLELSSDYAVDIGAWFRYATAHWSTVLGPAAGFLVIVGLIYLVSACFSFFGALLNYFVVWPMAAGLTLVCLKQLKGEPWTFGDFFAGFQRYSAFLLPNLITYLGPVIVFFVLYVATVLIAPNLKNEEVVLLAMGVVAIPIFCVYLFVYVRFGAFSWHLILDRHYTGIEALQGSWYLTRGHFWILFALVLLEGLINMGGYLSLCFGLLFTMPLTTLVNAAGYLLIAGTKLPLQRPGDAYERD
jgi:hypothetical protein